MSDDTTAKPEPAVSLQEQLNQANARLVYAELKNQALRSGMIDLDLLKLVDTTSLKPDANGDVPGAAEALSHLQREKPWMFAHSSSSQANIPSAPEPAKARNAMTMTRAEWQAAREKLIRNR